MWNSMIEAYDKARQRAAMMGRPVSKDEAMKSLYPYFAMAMRDNLQGRALDQEKDIFNKNYKLQQQIRNDAKPIGMANVAISGLGTLGSAYYMNQQDDLYRQKLNALMALYGGNK